MKIKTKYNIKDDVWVHTRKKPFQGHIKGVKVIAKEITFLSPNGASETKISIIYRYLINNKWYNEDSMALTKEELYNIKPWVEVKEKKKDYNTNTPNIKKYNKTSIDDLPL